MQNMMHICNNVVVNMYSVESNVQNIYWNLKAIKPFF